ncbi:MAG: PAS domain-containing protein [Bacteroidota bacterium]
MHTADYYQQLIHTLVKDSPTLCDWMHQEPLLGMGVVAPGEYLPNWNRAAGIYLGISEDPGAYWELLSDLNKESWQRWIHTFQRSAEEKANFCLGWEREGHKDRCVPISAIKFTHPEREEAWILLAIRWKDPEETPYVDDLSEVEALLQMPHHQVVIEALSEGIVVQNTKDEIVLCNDSAATILGLTKDQLLGKDSFDPRWKALKGDGTPFLPEEHPSVLAIRQGTPSVGDFDECIHRERNPVDHFGECPTHSGCWWEDHRFRRDLSGHHGTKRKRTATAISGQFAGKRRTSPHCGGCGR